jgi:cysteine synthase
VSQYIKGKYEGCEVLNPNLKTIAVEPREQMLITEAKGGIKLDNQGPHKIQGMGAGIIPKVLDLDLIDVVIPIHSDVAMEMATKLWMMGIPVGASAGAIVAAAVEEMTKPENTGKLAVAVIPSFGERYFSHPMFTDIKTKAEGLVKQPLPEPFDNTAYGFPSPRGYLDV